MLLFGFWGIRLSRSGGLWGIRNLNSPKLNLQWRIPQNPKLSTSLKTTASNATYRHPSVHPLPRYSLGSCPGGHQLLERGLERPARRETRGEGSAKGQCAQAPHPICTTVGNARLEIRTGLDGEALWDNVDTGVAPGEALEFGRRTTPRRSERSNWDLPMYL